MNKGRREEATGECAGLRWRELLLHGLLVLVPLVVLFPRVFFKGDMIGPGYVMLEMLPWKAYAEIDWPTSRNLCTWEFLGAFTGWYALVKEAIANGEWPLWSPYELTGLPLLANYQCAVFYPLRLLHAFLDLHLASTIFVLGKLWLCGFTSYICGRKMGLTSLAARFFSLAWMLCTYHLTWTYWAELDVGAWFPFVMLGFDRLARGRFRQGVFSVLFGGTLILLAGHPESAFTLTLGAGMYFVLRLVLERQHGAIPWKPIVLSGAAWAVAILVCAATILPFLEYAMNSMRAHLEPGEHALKLSAAVCFVVPRFFGMTAEENYWGHWNSNLTAVLYPGIAVLFAAPLVAVKASGRGLKRWTPVICLGVPILFAILMVFNHPIVQPLKRVPPFGSTWEAWYTPVILFNLAFLAALGLERWFSQARRLREMAWLAVPAVVAAVPLVWFYLFNKPTLAEGMDVYVRNQLLLAGVLACACLGFLAASCVWRKPRLFGAMLAVLLACDLLVAGRGLHPTTPPDRFWLRTDLTDYLKSIDPPPRVAVKSATIASGLMQYYGIEQWQGYDGLYPARFDKFFSTLQSDLWNCMEPVCSVQYYVHLPALHPFFPRDERGGFEMVKAVDGLEVYKNHMAFGRAFLVGNARIVPDSDEMFGIMRDPEFDPAKTVLLEAAPPRPMPALGDVSPGNAVFTGRTFNTVDVSVDANAPCILVLSYCFYPGWKAYVDGEPADIFPAYYAFRGVLVPEGQYQVRFQYEPWTFRVGLWVSTITLIAGLAAGAMLLVRKPKAA